MLKSLILGAAFSLSMGVSATAAIVDFSSSGGSDLSDGDILTAFDFGDGLTGSVSATGGTGDAVILDTDGSSGGTGIINDPDLMSPFTNVADPTDMRSFGNALIVQETGSSFPDDERRGGSITFTFETAVTISSITFLDGEEGSFASLFVGGDQIGALAVSGDNGFSVVEYGDLLSGITSFTVTFNGSGAIGEFEASVVPLPASVLLLGAGLGGLGLMRRRRKATAS